MNTTVPINIEPFFLDGPRAALFCLLLSPVDIPAKEAWLYLHPFAEEMHKSRRMAALQARTLAAHGHTVLQVDLTGCGDSAGDFGDATWSIWREDACFAHEWLARKSSLPVSLWGLRTGATLAADLASQMPNIQRLLLWQPVVNGDLFINQFLRIKLAAEMLAEGQTQSGTKALRALLERDNVAVEIGGYMLSPEMTRALGHLKLSDLLPKCPVHWLEVAMTSSGSLSPASQKVVENWQAQGIQTMSKVVIGDPFWVTQEITECHSLITESIKLTHSLTHELA